MSFGDVQGYLGQSDFGGGMNLLDPGPRQYFYGKNVVIRDGKVMTRPGTRRRWRSDSSGFEEGFYFNQDNAKYNDASHTGFWFPFDFVTQAWGDIQGVGTYRFPDEEEETIIFATEGYVYKQLEGYVEQVTCTPAIGAAETVSFVQANDYLYLFRGEDERPMRWDGTSTGFVEVPTAAGDDIPYAVEGVWGGSGGTINGASSLAGGRMWTFRDRDDVYASDILDPTEWDSVYQMFGIRPGDGDELVKLWPFHEDMVLCFKKRSITALGGINAIVDLGSGDSLANHVMALTVDTHTGLVARRAVVTVGEDVWYLGYGGIYSLRRNQQNKIERQPVPVSRPVGAIVDRVNWDAVDCAAAVVHDNYVIFALPLDEATENSAWLVYDLLAPAGQGQVGAWVGLWEAPGKVLGVVDFFTMGEDLLYLDTAGVVRQAFLDTPKDSDEPFADAPEYEADTTYLEGDLVYQEVGGADKLYTATVRTKGNAPPDTDYWTEVADPQHAFDIALELKTRTFKADSREPAMRLGRGEVLFEHLNPKLSVAVFSEDYGTEAALVTDQEYSPYEYDIADEADWDPATDADGLHAAHRKDYAVLMDSSGILVGAEGLVLNVFETHSVRFMKPWLNDRGFALAVSNRQGWLRVLAVTVPVVSRRHAAKRVI